MAALCEYKDKLIHFHHSIDRHPKDEAFPMHVHEQYEIFYFVSGEASYLVEGTEYSLKPGCLLAIRKMESHKIRILADKPYERFALHFFPEILDNIDPSYSLLDPFTKRSLGQNNLYRPVRFQTERPLELLEAMCAPAENEETRRLEVLIHLYPLLGILRHAFQQTQQQEIPNAIPSIAEQIVAYINRHLFDELSLDFLASRFFLSTSQLNRLFKQATGSSVWEYITIKRLVAAREKIKSGLPITAVCHECGFHDYSSFYRAYVARFGNAPKKDYNA